MLTFFRSNQLFTSILLIFYIAILQFSVFLAPFKWAPSGQGILSELVYGWLGSQDVISHVIAAALLLVQSFVINGLVINNRISNETNLFPGVFFILLSSSLPDFLYLSPVLMGNTFILFAMVTLFDTYKKPSCADQIFNAGFLVGFASLFYVPFLFFFILPVAGLNVLRSLNIREYLMSFTGVVMPYLLLGLYFFWTDQLGYFLENQFVRNFNFFSFGMGEEKWERWLKPGIFGLLILFVLLNLNTYYQKKNIQAQKKISLLYWVLAIGVLSALFQTNVTYQHFLVFTPSLGIFLAFTFGAMRPQWAEAIHLLMLVGVWALQFGAWYF